MERGGREGGREGSRLIRAIEITPHFRDRGKRRKEILLHDKLNILCYDDSRKNRQYGCVVCVFVCIRIELDHSTNDRIKYRMVVQAQYVGQVENSQSQQ